VKAEFISALALDLFQEGFLHSALAIDTKRSPFVSISFTRLRANGLDPSTMLF
jgi:hypothetical protein